MGEQPIFATKAHVFQIDPHTKKKWLPASVEAVSVAFYYDSARNTYRIISVDGTQAIINSTITANMTFTKTSVKFGQWSDPRANTVYGLGFGSESELSKFVEKFKEVKELLRQVSSQTNGSVAPSVGDTNHTVTTDVTPGSPAPALKAVTPTLTQGDTTSTPERRNSGSGGSSAAPSNQVVEQLKYENDRLKIALAQSSANAKKWEVELQTLKNNNARLTTALQESTSNVEEWKKQLAAYKEESARMKKRALEIEKTGGSAELLQRQLTDLHDKVAQLEKVNTQKTEEGTSLRTKIEELEIKGAESGRLREQIQALEKDNENLTKQTRELRDQLEISKSANSREKHQLQVLQEEMGTKVSELYGLSDKMADLLQQSQ